VLLAQNVYIKTVQEKRQMAHIVVLDDVLDAGVLIKRILERKGHEVAVFSEEEDALLHVESNSVDLAILDIKLKKMTGVEVLEEMKKRSPTTKAIMLTGYPTLQTAKESLEFGADEYCIKPIDKDELEAKVAEVLGP
jgi:DNA-binding NtrC family response regulator